MAKIEHSDTKWEYRAICLPRGYNETDGEFRFVQTLDVNGESGWELVSVMPTPHSQTDIYVFKRSYVLDYEE